MGSETNKTNRVGNKVAISMNLKIYKRGQGKNARLGTALVVFAIIAVGCWTLYLKLQSRDPWIQTLIPVAVCAVFAALIYWLMNKPSIADFLIAAEGEIKKVSWSTRKEIVNSTMIVIFVVVFMASGLGLVDFLFQLFFQQIVKLY
ncbi:MAG: preprotein translocase subunit SecE [Planctomycetes bacterium]|nr:preprotein translocase subunit SecE [Planctomycetota bacterium]